MAAFHYFNPEPVIPEPPTFCSVRFGAPKREIGHSDHIYVMSTSANIQVIAVRYQAT
ncbi:hypothetical protein [Novosphingobium sp. PhB165]|uniref:hypothetical protein n=1 Tax=Novosphingobium sp. PhB165 TaxID=2485105 RepID=UPI0014047D99|nr:hypothetical protein [Novosphingobium sp. PhB165]